MTDGNEAFRIVDGGAASLLIVVDHASNRVPPDIDLGIAPALLQEHIAYDIGVQALAASLARHLHCRAVLGTVSRLVCDLNRDEHAAGMMPQISDGIVIPGNAHADRDARLDRFHRPYHAELARQIATIPKPFILSLHSFTPTLRARPAELRPWEVGILYNQDRRAADVAIAFFEARGLIVGDQLPYSGRDLNYTMDRHAEANGIPYLGLEIRQDIIGQFMAGPRWDMLVALLDECGTTFA